jgi:hypothetical protein
MEAGFFAQSVFVQLPNSKTQWAMLSRGSWKR